ncbi:hypothetical protein [Streptomyces sp. NPDC058664]|uniref:hypothetical protein n=1 Tax=unclassified Streptomyces TaxID=2593676 RepID=UPI00364607CA
MKGSCGIENVPVGAVTLMTDGGDLVVTVEHDGTHYEAIRTVWPSGPDDGSIYHSMTANGLDAIFSGKAA